jgi:hypothetical protein
MPSYASRLSRVTNAPTRGSHGSCRRLGLLTRAIFPREMGLYAAWSAPRPCEPER